MFLFLYFFGVNLSYSYRPNSKKSILLSVRRWRQNLNSIDSLIVVPSMYINDIICQLETDEGPATLLIWDFPLCSWLVLIFFHTDENWQLYSGNCMTTLALLKLRVDYFLAQL